MDPIKLVHVPFLTTVVVLQGEISFPFPIMTNLQTALLNICLSAMLGILDIGITPCLVAELFHKNIIWCFGVPRSK